MSEVDFEDGNYLVHVRAQVMTRDDSTGGWVPMGGGGLSNVYVRKKIVPTDDEAKYEYQIYGKRLSDQSVVLCCTIKKDFEYNMVMPTFHHWRTDENKFGLTFQTAADAKSFRKGVVTAMEDVLEVCPEYYHINDADVGDDEVFMTVDLPVDSRSSSGSSSTGGSIGIVRPSSATPSIMNNMTTDPASYSSSSPYTHPHANHHHFHRMAFFRPPRTAPSTPNGNGSNASSKSGTNGTTNIQLNSVDQKIVCKENEDLWIRQDDLTHKTILKDKKEQMLDSDKIEILPGSEPYSYVQFADRPSRVESHEYSYPVVDTSKTDKRDSISSIKKHNLDIMTSPPLLPSKSKKKKDRKKDKHKNSLLDQSRCRHCLEMYRDDENGPGSCEYAPDHVRACINTVTCISCAHCMLYHCMSDAEGDFNHHYPCSCDSCDDKCGRRWFGLSILSIFVPCLWCYLPLRACHKLGVKCSFCGGRHATS